jgi:hypothetical protein
MMPIRLRPTLAFALMAMSLGIGLTAHPEPGPPPLPPDRDPEPSPEPRDPLIVEQPPLATLVSNALRAPTVKRLRHVEIKGRSKGTRRSRRAAR